MLHLYSNIGLPESVKFVCRIILKKQIFTQDSSFLKAKFYHPMGEEIFGL